MEYEIRGLRVRFPFRAYDCQLMFMERVIQALQEGSNALLESPTGTGKTLCLLCASLAWREAEQAALQAEGDARAARIFYLSRTHSQLTKVISELRASGYTPTTAILGARSQMCVNPAIKHLRGPRLNTACRALVARRGCAYHEGVAAKKDEPALVASILDIEELASTAEQHKCCPYYLSRQLQSTADIVFMPYNYALEPSARRTSKVDLTGSIMIFDEAHNLESFCEEATSATITSSDVRDALRDITPLLPRLARMPQQPIDGGRVASEFQAPASPTDDQPVDITAPDFAEACATLAAMLRALETSIERAPLGVPQPGKNIYSMLASAGATFTTATRLISCLDALSSVLQETLPDERQAQAPPAAAARNAAAAVPQQTIKPGAAAVGRLSEALKTIFVANLHESQLLARAEYFKVHVHVATQSRPPLGATANDTRDRELAFWCMSAGVAMQELRRLGVRNVLLASGTLSPLAHTAYEFQTAFPIRLENPHIVTPQQLWVGSISRGVSNVALNSSFRNRDSAAYKRELGATIVNFCRLVPAGLLVFFPSYTLLTTCVAYWKSPESSAGGATTAATVWDRICKYKHAVVEPKENAQFNVALQEYRARVSDPGKQGAVFFAVCRGKVAEGLDFADDMGRAVLVTGLPYPAVADDRVKVKRLYLDERAAAAAASTNNNANPPPAAAAAPLPADAQGGDNGAGIVATTTEKTLTGNDWYAAQAWRAVNQAVGRVIRHRWDYAAIVLLDERFGEERGGLLSRWLQPHFKKHGQFAEASLSLARFFKEGPTRVAEAKAKSSQDVPPAVDEPLAPPLLPPPLPPPPAAAAAAAVPAVMSERDRKAAELKSLVDSFKQQARAALAPAQYSIFQKTLVRYRQKEINVAEMMSILQTAFASAGAEKYAALMRDFVPFLPLSDQLKYKTAAMPESKATKEETSAGSKRRGVDLITGETTTSSTSTSSMANKAARLERAPQPETLLLHPPPSHRLHHDHQEQHHHHRHVPSPQIPGRPYAPISPLSHVIHSTPAHFTSPPAAAATPHSPSSPMLPPQPRPAPVAATPLPPPPPGDAVFSTPPPRSTTNRTTIRSPYIAASPSSPTPPPSVPPAAAAAAAAAAAIAVEPMQGVEQNEALDDKKEAQQQPQQQQPPPTRATTGKCAVCLEAPNDPCVARCGHVLCQACWEKQLSHKLECPVCKQKVRKSQVKRIYLG